MPRGNYATTVEVRKWKDRISRFENIPLNPNHNYKADDDIYERLTVYVKGWVEGMFMKYTDKETGELKSAYGKEENKDADEWIDSVGNYMTDLQANWWDVALNGKKESAEPLPYFANGMIKDGEDENTIRNDTQDAVIDHFFPVYRALQESYSKRWWFEWIFNHKQYTAERDALKVMTNLITSMTGYTKVELKEKYNNYCITIKSSEVAKVKVEEFERQQQEEMENLRQVEERLKHPELYKEEEPKMLDEYNKRYDDEAVFFQKLVDDLIRATQGSELNESSLGKAIPKHIHPAMCKVAKKLCKEYDEKNANGQLEADGATLMANGAKKMFEAAMKALHAVNENKETGEQHIVFNIKNLKDCIISAQKIADVMLKGMTPVGFVPKKYTEYGKGYQVLENPEAVRSFVKENFGQKYNEQEIDTAIKEAQTEFKILYRGKIREMPQVYQIGYRPDITKLEDERKAIGYIHRMVSLNPKTNKREIEDETLRVVINENVRRLKAVWASVQDNKEIDKEKMEASWKEADNKMKAAYPQYNPDDAAALVKAKVAEKEEQKAQQIKVDLNENKGNLVPPVQPKPADLNALKIYK